MRVQGWNTAAFLDTHSTESECSENQLENSCMQGSKKKSAQRKDSDVRTELIAKIKQKISSGFYSSESVIDDIGYGFAQAIDNSL